MTAYPLAEARCDDTPPEGVFEYPACRCDLEVGHDGPHENWADGLRVWQQDGKTA